MGQGCVIVIGMLMRSKKYIIHNSSHNLSLMLNINAIIDFLNTEQKYHKRNWKITD